MESSVEEKINIILRQTNYTYSEASDLLEKNLTINPDKWLGTCPPKRDRLIKENISEKLPYGDD